MMGSKENQTNIDLNDMEWENISAFISDLAKSNESVTDEALIEKTNYKNPTMASSNVKKSISEKTENYKKTIGRRKHFKTADMPENVKTHKHASQYDSLQSDVKNLLKELQEIKQARIELQTKLGNLRQ